MHQPPGFVDPKFPTNVCYLKKVMYDLKQDHCPWFHRFNNFLLTYDFCCSQFDPSMFTFRNDSHVSSLLIILF